MNDRIVLAHKFVELIPRELELNTIYISIRYCTAIHSCCCGCGNHVVTPFSPAEWKLTFDGRSVSLEPSIGNWSYPCRSHYWIKNNVVLWSHAWSDKKIKAARNNDATDIAELFRHTGGKNAEKQKARKPTRKPKGSFKDKIKKWLGRNDSQNKP